jgi:integrase
VVTLTSTVDRVFNNPRATVRTICRHDRSQRLPGLRERLHLRYLSTDEERRLLAAAAKWPHLQDLIVVALATGLRREELFGLKPSDVDLQLNLITVIGKGSKLRTVPLDPESKAWAILGRRKRESRSSWIFTSPHSGGKLTRVDRSLAAATSAAKIEDVTLHTMRHTFCTRLAAAGVDVRTIQELAGHEEIETTMKYVHLVERNLHLAVRLLTTYQENCHEFTTSEVVNFVGKRA